MVNGKDQAGAGTSLPTPVSAVLNTHSNTQNDSKPQSPEVYRAICQVAKAMSRDGVAKGRSNQQQGYKFRGVDDIMNALSAPLVEADLCILPRMLSRTQEERQTAKGGTLFYVTVHAHFAFVSARDGSRHIVAMYGEAMDSADKATNKAMSAAWKYACLQTFCIPTESMQDADATTPEPEPEPRQPEPRPRPAAELRAAAGIDTGGHSVGTLAAAKHVAETKIAAGQAKTSDGRPPEGSAWGVWRRAFAKLAEQLGSVVFLAELDRVGLTRIEDIPKKGSVKMMELYDWLDDMVRKQRGVA